jgi:hypothetical protein
MITFTIREPLGDITETLSTLPVAWHLFNIMFGSLSQDGYILHHSTKDSIYFVMDGDWNKGQWAEMFVSNDGRRIPIEDMQTS